MGNALASDCGINTTRQDFSLNEDLRPIDKTYFEFIAEVNALSKIDGCAKWEKMFQSVKKLSTVLCEDGNKKYCRVCLVKENSSSGIEIPLPAPRLKLISDCFIQWRDKQYGGAWGLNFVSDKDAATFYSQCQVETRRRRPISTSSSTSSVSNLVTPPPDGFNDNPSNSSLPHSQTPRIYASSDNHNLNDSGISSIPRTNPILPSKFKPHNENQSKGVVSSYTSSADSPCANEIPPDMDPVEYDYYRAALNHSDVSPNTSFNCSMGKDINASRHSLFVPTQSEDDSSYDQDAISYTRARSAINENPQLGATRKAGWLVVKSVLIHAKKGRLDTASNRRWKKYWVALKGVELRFYHCNEKTVTDQDLDEPSYKLDIDSCLVQAIPEHAKMNNVFSLSTKHGNVYFLQSTSQVEVENWLHCILTTAATTTAKQKGNGQISAILKNEIQRIEEKISSDSKLKKMAELQLTVVSDMKSKQNIIDQIEEWERSLESLHVDLFRFKCYACSLDGSPPPNSHSILTAVSKQTKQFLAKLGIFSVASFHAYITARQSTASSSQKKGGKIRRKKTGGGNLKSKLMDSLRIMDNAVVSAIRERHSPFNKRRQTSTEEGSDDTASNTSSSKGAGSNCSSTTKGKHLKVQLTNNKSFHVLLEDNMTIDDIIERVCIANGLAINDQFLMLLSDDRGIIDYSIPPGSALIQDQRYATLRLCPKMRYTVELNDAAHYESGAFGVRVSLNSQNKAIVTSVDEASPAMKSNIIDGDEITKFNNQDFDGNNKTSMRELITALNGTESVALELLSRRIDDKKQTREMTESMISFLVCPPPPKTTQPEINSKILDTMIIPPPSAGEDEDSVTKSNRTIKNHETSGVDIEVLLGRAEEVTTLTREMTQSPISTQQTQQRVSTAFKLRKAIYELVDTEKTYLKNLCLLLDRYLIPMKEEEFLAKDEAEMLVGNVSEIYDFQTSFLDNLEQNVKVELLIDDYIEIDQFRNVIYSIGETFLEYSEKFKLYSTFCSCHSRAVKLLKLESNDALQRFLEARNPKQQHSGTLESYLITPIQRVLKYPLLMKTMLKDLKSDSDEFNCLNEALTSVKYVADYINEMQRISETFTPHFQEISQSYHGIETTDVEVDNLLHYGRAKWIQDDVNRPNNGTVKRVLASSNKQKRDTDNELTIFVFKKAVILLLYEQKQRKKTTASPSSIKVKTKEEIKFETLIPTDNMIIRDHAWSDSDLHYLWEIVDTSSTQYQDGSSSNKEVVYTFVNGTGEEKRVFVNALKESTKNGSARQNSTLTKIYQNTRDQNENIERVSDGSHGKSLSVTMDTRPKPKPSPRKPSSNLKKLRSMFE